MHIHKIALQNQDEGLCNYTYVRMFIKQVAASPDTIHKRSAHAHLSVPLIGGSGLAGYAIHVSVSLLRFLAAS